MVYMDLVVRRLETRSPPPPPPPLTTLAALARLGCKDAEMDESTITEDQFVKATSRLTLLDLPVEVLEDIFDRAYWGTTPSGPLCRALLPFYHQGQHRVVDVFSYGELNKLCKAARHYPVLGVCVKSLGIVIRREDTPFEDTPFDQANPEAHDAGSPSERELKALFRCLPSLTDLYVAGSSRIAKLILDFGFASDSRILPNLRYLSFNTDWHGWTDAFDPSLYTSIPVYNKLQELWLGAGKTKPVPVNSSSRSLPSFRIKTVRRLAIILGSEKASSVPSLLPLFDNLQKLQLIGETTKPSFFALLATLPSPSQLRELVIDGKYDGAPWTITDILPILTSLRSLTLSGRCDALSPTFYRHIARLPVKILKLGESVKVSAAGLQSLVEGDERSRTLQTLVLDHLYGVQGRSLSTGGARWAVLGGRYPHHGGWTLPSWTAEFTFEGFRALIEAARSAGVAVSGMAVEAYFVQEQYDEEEKALELLTGEDWSNSEDWYSI